MATARKTPAELRTELNTLKAHADSSEGLKEFAKRKTEMDRTIGGTTATPVEILKRMNSYLGQTADLIELRRLQKIVSWIRSHQGDISDASIALVRTRLAALEVDPLLDRDAKRFLVQIMERDPAVGHDDEEAMKRLNAELAKPPARINHEKLARLTQRWETIEENKDNPNP
jgi:hypothetical protein